MPDCNHPHDQIRSREAIVGDDEFWITVCLECGDVRCWSSYFFLKNPKWVPSSVNLFIEDDKTADTCRNKFDNRINFHGEPFDPGLDVAPAPHDADHEAVIPIPDGRIIPVKVT